MWSAKMRNKNAQRLQEAEYVQICKRAPSAIDGNRRNAAIALAMELAPHFQRPRHGNFSRTTFDTISVHRAIQQHWAIQLGEDALWECVEQAQKCFEAAGDAEYERRQELYKKREAERQAERARARAEERAKEKEQEKKTEQVRKLMDCLGVGQRQAQRLVKFGTTNPRQADRLAEVLGTEARQHLRKAARPGREIDLVARFMRGYVDRCSWRDFIEDDEGPDGKLAAKFTRFYAERARDTPDHFETFEALTDFASTCGFHKVETSKRLWDKYKFWRIRMMADLVLDRLGPDADEFNFG